MDDRKEGSAVGEGDDSSDELDQEGKWQAVYALPPRFEEPNQESPRFNAGDPAALEYLREYGYVVFASVLSPQEVETATDLFWEFLEDVTGGQVRRGRAETWGAAEWPGQRSNSLFAAPGIGQAPVMWFVRTRPAVLRAFCDIWGVQDPGELVVSFDGVSAFRPTAVDPSWRTKGGWFHTDQNGRTTGSGFVCAQGFVALVDNDETTGGLAVLPGSHKHHREIFERWPLERENDFFILPRSDPLLSRDSTIRPRVVKVRAGDLAIWDSRCVHCNVPARHRFDEEPLAQALESLGLKEAGAPLLRDFTSVSDVCWAFSVFSTADADRVEGALLRMGLESEHVAPLLEAITAWRSELALDLKAQGTPRLTQPVQLARMVTYVCALPRARVPPEELARRVKAALLGSTTTHWPDKCFVVSSYPTRRNLRFILDQDAVVLRLIGCQGEDRDAMHEDLDRAWAAVHAEAAEQRNRQKAA